jgi:hypothetical protein
MKSNGSTGYATRQSILGSDFDAMPGNEQKRPFKETTHHEHHVIRGQSGYYHHPQRTYGFVFRPRQRHRGQFYWVIAPRGAHAVSGSLPWLHRKALKRPFRLFIARSWERMFLQKARRSQMNRVPARRVEAAAPAAPTVAFTGRMRGLTE